MWDPYALFQEEILPNGLRICAAQWEGRSWQHVYILVHSGAVHDLDGLEGAAHFMEHLVSENGNLPLPEIEDFFRPYGRPGLGATGWDSSYYNFSVPANQQIFSEGLNIFGNMLVTAKLEKCVERERQVIVGEFRQRYVADYEYDLAARKQRALFHGHPIGRATTPLGSLESIARIAQSDLQSFYDCHYTPKNMTIITCGGLSLRQVAHLIQESPFGLLKNGMARQTFTPATTHHVPSETRHVVDLKEYRSADTRVGAYLSESVLPGIVKKSAVQLFSTLLSEVLFEEIRLKRAWTYSVYSEWHPVCGLYSFIISAEGLVPEAMTSIEEVVENSILRVTEDDATFKKYRGAVRAQVQMLDIPGHEVSYNTMMELAAFGKIPNIERALLGIETVTLDNMKEIACMLAPRLRYTQLSLP
ncbi:MAG: pitrilysin family protein [Minisyncoccia bacterium]